jgi:hypothetical protein
LIRGKIYRLGASDTDQIMKALTAFTPKTGRTSATSRTRHGWSRCVRSKGGFGGIALLGSLREGNDSSAFFTSGVQLPADNSGGYHERDHEHFHHTPQRAVRRGGLSILIDGKVSPSLP